MYLIPLPLTIWVIDLYFSRRILRKDLINGKIFSEGVSCKFQYRRCQKWIWKPACRSGWHTPIHFPLNTSPFLFLLYLPTAALYPSSDSYWYSLFLLIKIRQSLTSKGYLCHSWSLGPASRTGIVTRKVWHVEYMWFSQLTLQVSIQIQGWHVTF